jgi:hypothetical protein
MRRTSKSAAAAPTATAPTTTPTLKPGFPAATDDRRISGRAAPYRAGGRPRLRRTDPSHRSCRQHRQYPARPRPRCRSIRQRLDRYRNRAAVVPTLRQGACSLDRHRQCHRHFHDPLRSDCSPIRNRGSGSPWLR